MSRQARAIAAVLMLWSCSKAADQKVTSKAEEAAKAAVNAAAPAVAPPATGPDAKTPLAEPNGTIDPKSVEAAGHVVQRFGALIEQNRFGEAEKLWSNPEAAAAFTAKLHPWTHLEIGNLGQSEGAAGSIYTTVPVVFFGDTFRQPATIVLRRINDVPGSTEVQRRWHIQRIDWKAAS